MYLIRLIYASKISTSFEPNDINRIVESSKENNDVINVSGVLVYNNDYFLQCLEGSRICVNQLYHKILLDKRHNDPSILKYEEISKRDFEQWHMGYIPPSNISGSLTLKYSGERKFNPYSMSGKACHFLLKELTQLGIAQ